MAVKILAYNDNDTTGRTVLQRSRLVSDNSGRYWFAAANSTTITFYYSDDSGNTWSAATGTLTTSAGNAMLFFIVDSDGNIHCRYDDGTPNARYIMGTVSGSTITWKTPLTVGTSSLGSIVAFPFGTGWKAFIGEDATDQVVYEITVNSSYVPTLTATHTVTTAALPSTARPPTVAFAHTGDGLTVDSPAHVFVGYGKSTGGMFFRKLSESGGTWSLGAERTIHATAVFSTMVADGFNDRVLFVNGGGTTPTIWDRDFADTTTTQFSNPGALTGGVSYDLTTDSVGNGYFVGVDSSSDPYYTKWTRSTDTWSSWTQVEATTTVDLSPSWSAGYIAGPRGLLWVNTSATPDDHWFEQVVVFTTDPTWVSPAEGSAERRELELVLDWDFNDPNPGDTQTAYTLKRVVDAVTTTYWNGSSWQASEDASTKVSSATSAHTLSKNWAAPEDTQHVYSVKTWDSDNNVSSFSTYLTIYPTSIASSNRGLAFPKPWKRQEDILATLKANNDYLLAFNNNYVPTYGDANQDLTLRAGIRTSNTSLMRDVFPPVIGSYSVGNGTSYFQDLGATNVYRTNEIALSSRKSKKFHDKHRLPNAVDFITKIPVTTWEYKDKRRMGDAKERIGFTAEDFLDPIHALGVTPKDSAILFNQGRDEDGEVIWYLNQEQLVPILWQAVQELAAEVFKLKEKPKITN